MNCAHCGRRLSVPARSIKTQGGMLHFGPVCAKRVFVAETRTAHRVVTYRQQPVVTDPAQMELEIA
jgi:hypothetical protein